VHNDNGIAGFLNNDVDAVDCAVRNEHALPYRSSVGLLRYRNTTIPYGT